MELRRTLEVASRLEQLAEVGSTNAALREQMTDAAAWPHLSVLFTTNQTAGRGRRDREWQTPPGSALAISVLLRELPAPALRGWIPLMAGLAMTEAVASLLPAHTVALKWPNDVQVGGRKICGILAEATGDAVIVGAGVNTAMTAAQLPVPEATSFAVLGAEADLDRLMARYLRQLNWLLTSLVAAGDAVSCGLVDAVSARTATLGQAVRVILPGDSELRGTATRIDVEGRLVVRTADGETAVTAGDVVHLRPASDTPAPGVPNPAAVTTMDS